MTMALALRCKDGIVLATDGKVTRASTSYRTVARIWQRTNKTHHVPPHVLVAGAGELALIHAAVDAAAQLPDDERAKGIDGVVPAIRQAIVAARAEGVSRYASIYGKEAAPEHAPRAYFLVVAATPEPRLVYVSEDADVEDQTHLGYAATGSGDLIVHVRMQPWDTSRLSVEQGALLAYGLIKDTIDSGTFRVSDPVQVWSVRTGEAPVEWDEARTEKLGERYHAFRQAIVDLLART
jgi:hypothetical protein